jgi:hypothetical protein
MSTARDFSRPASLLPGTVQDTVDDTTLCFCREPFLATIEPQQGAYSFRVRDLSRERPTIHGSGLSLEKALAAVAQLLEALPAEASH